MKNLIVMIIASIIIAAIIPLTLFLAFPHSENTNPDNSVVMITNIEGNSGGSGSVVFTSETESHILTNAHVCEIVRSNGLVVTSDNKKHLVIAFQVSKMHDLCLVKVAERLSTPLLLSPLAPKKMDDARIFGHPNLLPDVRSQGHFSEKSTISILTGIEPCTEADKADEGLNPLCTFLDGIPIIKTFEAILVTALIMPGSSGSAIVNHNNQISGVVFAGKQGLSYAFAVPYEFVANFLNNEVKVLPEQFPTHKIDIRNQNVIKKRSLKEDVKRFCDSESSKKQPVIENLCTNVVVR